MKRYRKRAFCGLFTVALVSAVILANSSMTIAAQNNGADSEQSLRALLAMATNENVLMFDYSDFDNEGRYEAFAFTGEIRKDEMFAGDNEAYGLKEQNDVLFGKLWFINTSEAAIIRSDGTYWSIDKNFSFDGNKYIILEQFFQTGSLSHVYGVKNGEAYELPDVGGGGLNVVDKNNITIVRDYYADGGGHIWETHKLSWDNGFKEKKNNISSVNSETEQPNTPISGGKQTEAKTEGYTNGITGKRGFILMQIGKETMTVNDETVEIDPGRGTTPLIKNNHTLLPIRAVIEAMNGSVGWDESESKVTISALGHNLEIWLGRQEMTVDGESKMIDVPPEAINGRTMVPVRVVAESLGCSVQWLATSQEVVIVYPL